MTVNFHCNTCNREYTHKWNYLRHMKTHHANNEFGDYDGTECLYCHKTFANKYTCRRHMVHNCSMAQNVNQNPQNVNQNPQNVNQNPQFVNQDQHTCDQCQKVFTRADNLTRHKRKCKGKNSLKCPKCEISFNTRQAQHKHSKSCVGSTELIVPQTVTNPPLVQNIQTVQNMQAANNINNSVNVHINNFGSENISHITTEVLDKCLMQLHGKGIANLITDTHFNPERPENHNIRMYNKRDKMLQVKQNESWSIRSNDEILDFLMLKYKNMLTSRLFDEDFHTSLKYKEDYFQIQQDIMNIDKYKNSHDYYAIVRRVLAGIENIETYYMQKHANDISVTQ